MIIFLTAPSSSIIIYKRNQYLNIYILCSGFFESTIVSCDFACLPSRVSIYRSVRACQVERHNTRVDVSYILYIFFFFKTPDLENPTLEIFDVGKIRILLASVWRKRIYL